MTSPSTRLSEAPRPETWRLRDLRGAQLWAALAIALLLAVPFAISAGRALSDDWVPSGDEAVIAARIQDVLDGEWPLTGLPSTSDLYGDGIRTRHPGPIQFYVLAVPFALLGPSAGMLVGTACINVACVLLAAWVALRRAGPGVGALAAALLAAAMWSAGGAVLSDPISSMAGSYALIATAFLAWALACGDHRLAPVAVAVASFGAQQHLGIALPVVAVAGVGGVVLLVVTAAASRQRRHIPEADRPPPSQAWRWIGAAAVVGAVLWAPVVVDQITGDPGNVGEVVRFARDGGRESVGARHGLTQVLRVTGLPPYLLRNDLVGSDVIAPLSPATVIAGALALAGILAVALVGHPRGGARSRLAATTLVLALAGFLSGSSVPNSFESGRINLYRWTWPLAVLAWLTLGWSAGLIAERRISLLRRLPDLVGPVAAATAVTLLVVVGVDTTGSDDERRDAEVYDIDRDFIDAGADAVGSGPVFVMADGSLAILSVAPAVTAGLADRGIEVEVPPSLVDAWGDHRAFEPGNAESALVIVSGFGELPDAPGDLVEQAQLNPEQAELAERLTETATSGPAEASSQALEIRADYPEAIAALTGFRIDRMAIDPSGALTSPLVVDWLRRGYLDEPDFDEGDLDEWAEALPDMRFVWGDDRIAMYELSIDELREYRPNLFT